MPVAALVTIFATLALLTAAVWAYSRRYPRRSVTPADYPWLQRAATQTPEQIADALLARMSLREKLGQLSGDGGALVMLRLGVNVLLYRQFPNVYAGYDARLRIPPISFSDGPRGIVIGRATAFPVAMARGASWDPELERRVGDALGREARAAGANCFGGVCVNLLRHPGWGRAQETYGEDPHHVGEMAASCIEAVQRHNVMACVKHFALNSIENSRFYVDVRIDERSLHEVYLAQFRRCVDAGAASVMSAYNRVNGDYCAHQRWLLEEVLRGQWGFEGFVSSDWVWGLHDAVRGIEAGMDVEMPRARCYGRPLRRAIARGEVSQGRIDELVRRVLTTKLRFVSRRDPEAYSRELLAGEAHVRLAQEAAERSMVLLENREACLPLGGVRRLAVIGGVAARPNTGDHGSSRTSPPYVMTLLDGMREWLGGDAVAYCVGDDTAAAATLAARCDAALVVAGCGPQDEGENLYAHKRPSSRPRRRGGGDRESLALPPEQAALIRAVGSAQPRSVVTLIGGSAIHTDEWRDAAAAIVMAWYPGMMGGRALARLLSGEADFSGRLPFAWPGARDRLPEFDSRAESVEYGYHHGYTWFDATGQQPAYPFGFGLGYGRVAFAAFTAELRGGALEGRVTLSNVGARRAREVVQCYVGMIDPPVPRHRKRLAAFTAVSLAPGERRTIPLTVPLERLRRYCPLRRQWLIDPGRYRLWAGPSSDESSCLRTECEIRNGEVDGERMKAAP